jgi:membrane protein YqaA with SNARE-associated domain
LLRSVYNRVMALAGTRWATPTLAAVSFAEASFLPIIPEVLLGPMVLARQERAWWYALVCTVASVLGGLFGYAIGVFLTPLGLQLLRLFGHGQGMEAYQAWFADNGFWVILLKGFTPIPFKLVTIASGIARFDLLQFTAAAVLTRGGRFFLGAALLRHPRAKALVEKHLLLLSVLGVLAVIAALVAVKFLAPHGAR